MVNLFTYGTLQLPGVQQHIIGRSAPLETDVLPDYRTGKITLSLGTYLIAEPARGKKIFGSVISVTDEELQKIDRYETKAYARVEVTLQSDTKAQAYVQPKSAHAAM